MAAATIATTLSTRQQTQYSVTAHAANGMKMQIGIITWDGGTYVTNGTSFTIPAIPVAKNSIIIINPVDGYVFSYDYVNEKILVWESGADAGALDEFANGGAISLVTRYLVIGY